MLFFRPVAILFFTIIPISFVFSSEPTSALCKSSNPEKCFQVIKKEATSERFKSLSRTDYLQKSSYGEIALAIIAMEDGYRIRANGILPSVPVAAGDELHDSPSSYSKVHSQSFISIDQKREELVYSINSNPIVWIRLEALGAGCELFSGTKTAAEEIYCRPFIDTMLQHVDAIEDGKLEVRIIRVKSTSASSGEGLTDMLPKIMQIFRKLCSSGDTWPCAEMLEIEKTAKDKQNLAGMQIINSQMEEMTKIAVDSNYAKSVALRKEIAKINSFLSKPVPADASCDFSSCSSDCKLIALPSIFSNSGTAMTEVRQCIDDCDLKKLQCQREQSGLKSGLLSERARMRQRIDELEDQIDLLQSPE